MYFGNTDGQGRKFGFVKLAKASMFRGPYEEVDYNRSE